MTPVGTREGIITDGCRAIFGLRAKQRRDWYASALSKTMREEI